MRSFLRDEVEKKDITVVPGVLPELSRKEQLLVPRSTATKTTITLKAENKEKDEEVDHSQSEKHFNVKQATVLPSAIKKQALFTDAVSCAWLRSEKLRVG